MLLMSGKYAAINVGNVTKTKTLIVVAKNVTHDGNRSALRNKTQRQYAAARIGKTINTGRTPTQNTVKAGNA
jgi:hypothetical protein